MLTVIGEDTRVRVLQTLDAGRGLPYLCDVMGNLCCTPRQNEVVLYLKFTGQSYLCLLVMFCVYFSSLKWFWNRS